MNKEKQLKILTTLYPKYYGKEIGHSVSTEQIIKETFPDEENPKFIPELDDLEQEGLVHGTHANGTVYPLWIQITEYGIELVEDNNSELKQLHDSRRIKILNYLNSKYEESGSHVDFDIDEIINEIGLNKIDFDEIFQEFNYLLKKGFLDCTRQLGRKHIMRAKINKYGRNHLEYLVPIQDSNSFEPSINNENTEKIYDSNAQYDIYKNLKNIVKEARKEVFIVDGYPDESIYDLYVDVIPESIPIRILTKKYSSKFVSVGKLLSKKRSLEIREDDKVHDRYIFVDDKCWMLGASIKDAGIRPTVLAPIKDKDELYKIWKSIFDDAKTVL